MNGSRENLAARGSGSEAEGVYTAIEYVVHLLSIST